MVGSISPHVYRHELFARSGSANLLQQIREVDRSCRESQVTPLYTLNHLAIVAGMPYEAARDAIFDHRSHYTSRKLAKKSGNGFRTIHEPSSALKSLQRAILHNCLPKNTKSLISFAFDSGSGTIHAARKHIGAKSMVHVDVRDFFGSIDSISTYSIFSGLGYPELLSLEMSLLTSVGHEVTLKGPDENGLTYEILKKGHLPQGASTSGRLSNLKCVILDGYLLDIANRYGGVITRYADDISFSAPVKLSRAEGHQVYLDIKAALKATGLSVNERKTRIIWSANEFRMLGLCVGEKSVWLNRNYKQSIRAHLHGLEIHGLANHADFRGYVSDLNFMDFIWGHYAYAAGVDKQFANEIRSRLLKAGVPRF